MAPFATHRITHWRRGLWLTNASWAWCEQPWKARMYQPCKMPLPGNPIDSFEWHLRKMLFLLLSTSWHIINLYQSVRDLFGWLCRELSIAWEACSFVQPLSSSGRWQRANCDYGGVVNVAFWWAMHPILAVYSSRVTEKKDTKILAFDTSRLVQWAIYHKRVSDPKETHLGYLGPKLFVASVLSFRLVVLVLLVLLAPQFSWILFAYLRMYLHVYELYVCINV